MFKEIIAKNLPVPKKDKHPQIECPCTRQDIFKPNLQTSQ